MTTSIPIDNGLPQADLAALEEQRWNESAATVPADWTDEAEAIERIIRARGLPPWSQADVSISLEFLVNHGLAERRRKENSTQYQVRRTGKRYVARTMRQQLDDHNAQVERAAREIAERDMRDAEAHAQRYREQVRQEFRATHGWLISELIDERLNALGLMPVNTENTENTDVS